MLRSILVALDDTPGARSARDFAVTMARQTKASLTAAVILDLPHTAEDEATPIGGYAYKERRDAARIAQAEKEAEDIIAACTAAAEDVPFDVLHLIDAPEPALRAASARVDMLVIGRDSTLGQEQAEDGLAPTIEGLLRHGARPLLVVPPGMPLRTAGPVLIGYDGSLPCMRAVQLYAQLRPLGNAPVKVVSVGATAKAAQELADVACAYLIGQGLTAEAHGSQGDHPADVLLSEASALHARMLVIGAFETSSLRQLLRGSATRKLLTQAPCPIFVAH
ncbi:nucleotide-binding universal stress UspA family protein [Humitalea rosea]|uniref:Nucleotide-binding universal stress UspA family protein n=1 Tax=Humitalea rosea TaxID=990373 RepID=A0A2W7HV58_9PROT|nr:universal stress protein [Humitalea rosea]PZW38526.1 nucleotide-binding universal stress UspA family protein [Humitalea rosea]